MRSRAPRQRTTESTLVEQVRCAALQSHQKTRSLGLLVLRPLTPHGKGARIIRPAHSEALRALGRLIHPLIRRADELLITSEGIAVLLHDPSVDGARCVAQRLIDTLSAPADMPEVSEGMTPLRLGIGYSHETLATRQEESDNAPSITPASVLNARCDALFADACEAATRAFVLLPHAPHATAMSGRASAGAGKGAAQAALQNNSLRRNAQTLGAPYIHLPTQLSATCRQAISYELASKLHAIPIGRTRTTLTVAMERPDDQQALLQLRLTTGLAIFPVLSASDEIERALASLASEP
ncbi:MAG TPA: hypothetical protein VKQ36_08815 [Ktedonobacterales bacterium]|nr:hypothetical protein [Ktedonobacterales bacterium]